MPGWSSPGATARQGCCYGQNLGGRGRGPLGGGEGRKTKAWVLLQPASGEGRGGRGEHGAWSMEHEAGEKGRGVQQEGRLRSDWPYAWEDHRIGGQAPSHGWTGRTGEALRPGVGLKSSYHTTPHHIITAHVGVRAYNRTWTPQHPTTAHTAPHSTTPHHSTPPHHTQPQYSTPPLPTTAGNCVCARQWLDPHLCARKTPHAGPPAPP